MDALTTFATHLAHGADHAALRLLAIWGSLALAGLVTLALAFAVGTLVADLLAPASEGAILAAPFRW